MEMPEMLAVNGTEFRVKRLLGKGKGGYSYLAERDGERYVIKQIHHEPCGYYQFGDKLASELRDYARLSALGLWMPRLLDSDAAQERILKEYIEGETVYDLVLSGRDVSALAAQVRQMCGVLYPAGLNIDYFPTNFVVRGGLVYYIDYECNEYMQEWDFEHWGLRYWSRTTELLAYAAAH